MLKISKTLLHQLNKPSRFLSSTTTGYSKPPPIELKKVRANKSTNKKNSTNNNEQESNSGGNKLLPLALLSIPLITFSLGVWQIQRRKQKVELIEYLHSRTTSKPVPLPTDLKELANLVQDNEYKPFKVKGHFLHSREVILTPRHDMTGRSHMPGGLVITPFVISRHPDLIILVNRGYVPYTHYKPMSRQEAQVEHEVELVGLLRSDEITNSFTPINKPPSEWHHRNVKEMAEALGTLPIFLDASEESNIKGGPLGGQTAINLRNEHMSYIITWFTLSAFTSVMWWRRFARILF